MSRFEFPSDAAKAFGKRPAKSVEVPKEKEEPPMTRFTNRVFKDKGVPNLSIPEAFPATATATAPATANILTPLSRCSPLKDEFPPLGSPGSPGSPGSLGSSSKTKTGFTQSKSPKSPNSTSFAELVKIRSTEEKKEQAEALQKQKELAELQQKRREEMERSRASYTVFLKRRVDEGVYEDEEDYEA